MALPDSYWDPGRRMSVSSQSNLMCIASLAPPVIGVGLCDPSYGLILVYLIKAAPQRPHTGYFFSFTALPHTRHRSSLVVATPTRAEGDIQVGNWRPVLHGVGIFFTHLLSLLCCDLWGCSRSNNFFFPCFFVCPPEGGACSSWIRHGFSHSLRQRLRGVTGMWWGRVG
jgi:hypothetical protein